VRYWKKYDHILADYKNRGLRDDFEGKKELTLFAPTNEAVEKFKELMGEKSWSGHRRSMEEIIRYHGIPNYQLIFSRQERNRM
jgi:uncharacterized surface protein with fasciclin (FAS1) repeats